MWNNFFRYFEISYYPTHFQPNGDNDVNITIDIMFLMDSSLCWQKFKTYVTGL